MNMNETDEDLKEHYEFDYSKARPNRFAEKYNRMVVRVGLEPDVAEEFPTEESVNEALRDYLRLREQRGSELPTR